MPKIKTTYDDAHRMHPIIEAQYNGGDEPARFCGDSWCTGKCGLPALVIPAGDMPEMKAHSSMAAFGPVMQPWRVAWTGEKVQIPEEHREAFMMMYWR